MPGVESFYEELQDLANKYNYEKDFTIPETHVTLFIKQQVEDEKTVGQGIAITNYEGQIAGEVFPNIEVSELNISDIK